MNSCTNVQEAESTDLGNVLKAEFEQEEKMKNV